MTAGISFLQSSSTLLLMYVIFDVLFFVHTSKSHHQNDVKAILINNELAFGKKFTVCLISYIATLHFIGL